MNEKIRRVLLAAAAVGHDRCGDVDYHDMAPIIKAL